MKQPPKSEAIRNAPIALWRLAGEFLRTIFGLFGQPERIAEQHTFTATNYKLALKWLRITEAIVRELLLIEAAALPRPLPAPAPRAPRRHQRGLHIVWADNPDAWRVSFSCFAGAPRTRVKRLANARARTDAMANAPRFYSAWPIAERVEAILRVYNEPVRYARRLARRLSTNGPVARPRLLRAKPEDLEYWLDPPVHAELRSLTDAADQHLSATPANLRIIKNFAAPLTRVSDAPRPCALNRRGPMEKTPQHPPRLWIGFLLLALWLAVVAGAVWAIWLAPSV